MTNLIPNTSSKEFQTTKSGLTKEQKIRLIVATAQQEQTSSLTKDKYLGYLPGKTQVPIQYLPEVLRDCNSEEIDKMFRNYIQKPVKRVKPILIGGFIFFLSYLFISGLIHFTEFELLN